MSDAIGTVAPVRQAGWVEILARAGYAAKGVVFGTVGVLALISAVGWGSGGEITGAKGAIDALADKSFGWVILALVGLGLAAFALWRYVQCFMDPEDKGSGAKALVRRAGLGISGLSYTTLAIFSLSRLVGASSGGGSESSSEEQAATIMSHTGGVWAVGLFGLGMIGVGLYQAYRAYSTPFRDSWRTQEMSVATDTWATRISRFGIAARALSFTLIGWFFAQAALQADPDQAKGLSGVLRELASGPYGVWWLGTIGAGFICYGLYCLINSRFKHIDP